jgi:NodT family efflux transporter outer membrane factor (OMF) lipoprotein
MGPTHRPWRAPGAALLVLLASCAVGPDYQRPATPPSSEYKEAREWKQAEPSEAIERGKWWVIYNDPVLNELEQSIDVSNESVKLAEAQYRQALALAREASASLWPSLSANASATRQSQGSSRGAAVSGGSGGAVNLQQGISDIYTLGLQAAWELDLWGGLRRQAESGREGAYASHGDLENMRLSMQSQLANDYFALRTADATRQLLDDTIEAYDRSAKITRNQYAAGVAARVDVAQAETQLEQTKAQAIDIDVGRAQLEHAIAILIGKAPSEFSLPAGALNANMPAVPLGLPSDLLERRPDVAAAERRVAAANAQIGVARAAFFPSLTLAASGGYASSSTGHLISAPNRFWSLGPALTLPLFEGGKLRAQAYGARAGYDAAVATYRQTVLGAFQSVEDNLAALRILEQEATAQDRAVKLARESVTLAINQYKAGTVSYLNVVTVQATALVNERTAVSILGRRLNAHVTLITALGGGWNERDLAHTIKQ